jgi:hypothetical protein
MAGVPDFLLNGHKIGSWGQFFEERLGAKLVPRHEVGAYARVDAYATVAPALILRLVANFMPRRQLLL